MSAGQLEFPTATDIALLVVGDPRHADEHAAVLAAIQADFDEHGSVDANRVRPRIPAWVYSRVISATYSALRNRGLLIPTGEWVVSTDAKGRNVGKPQKVYTLTERVA